MTLPDWTMAVNIRPAISEDAPGIALAFLDSAEHHASLDPVRYQVPTAETIVARYREPGAQGGDLASITLVAECGGEIVGFVEARCEPSPDPMHREVTFCHVTEISVGRRSRSHGIGRALLQAVERWGRQQGARFALLEYHAANTRAGEFYRRRMGYTIAAISVIKPL